MKEEFDIWMTYRPWRRHGVVLFTSGLFFMNFGLALAREGEERERRIEMARVAIKLLPLELWAGLFVGVGFSVALLSRFSFFKPPLGYSALTGLSAAWSASYLIGYFFYGAPPVSLNTGIFWLFMVTFYWAVSGLVSPDRRGKPLIWFRPDSQEKNGPD